MTVPYAQDYAEHLRYAARVTPELLVPSTNPFLAPPDVDAIKSPSSHSDFAYHLDNALSDRPGLLPTRSETSAAAEAGITNVGQYHRSFQALTDLLGEPDSHTWAALNSVLSAQTEWKTHTLGALRLLGMWHDAGRPTDTARLEHLIRDFHAVRVNGARLYPLLDTGYNEEGKPKDGKYWKSIRILQAAGGGTPTADDYRGLIAAGGQGKTPEFYTAFQHPSGVALDTWMKRPLSPPPMDSPELPDHLAREALSEPFPTASHQLVSVIYRAGGKDLVKKLGKTQQDFLNRPAVYAAYKALVGQVAADFGWEPRGVQEAVWTTLAAVAAMRDLGLPADKVLPHLRHGENRLAWDMVGLLGSDPEALDELSRFGLGPEDVAAVARTHARPWEWSGGVRVGDPASFETLARRVPTQSAGTAAEPIAAAARPRLIREGVIKAGRYTDEYGSLLRYEATHADLHNLLGQLTLADRSGQGDHTLRLVTADALSEHGREREADLLRDPGRHVLVKSGVVVPGRFSAHHVLDALEEANDELFEATGINPYNRYPVALSRVVDRWGRTKYRPRRGALPADLHLTRVRERIPDDLLDHYGRPADLPQFVHEALDRVRTAPIEEEVVLPETEPAR